MSCLALVLHKAVSVNVRLVLFRENFILQTAFCRNSWFQLLQLCFVKYPLDQRNEKYLEQGLRLNHFAESNHNQC